MKRMSLLLMIVLTAITVIGCGNEKEVKNSNENFITKNLVWPEWSNPIEVVIDEDTMKGPKSVRKTFDIKTARENVSKMRYLVENTENTKEFPYHNVWKNNLAFGLLKLGEYELAIKYLKEIIELPDDAAYGGKFSDEKFVIKPINKSETRERAHAFYLKALAKLGLKDEMISEYNKYNYLETGKVSGWRITAAAWAMALSGEKEEAYKLFEFGIEPENLGELSPWISSSDVLSAVSYAYTQGDYDKINQFTDRLLKEGENSVNPEYFLDNDIINGKKSNYFSHHWKSSYRLAKAYNELGQRAKNGEIANFENLKDGTYSSSNPGYMFTPIEVTIVVENGKVTSIKTFQNNPKDDRSGTAIEAMPERILKVQSLEIDGIASASISSESVKLGVAQALIKAKK